MSDYCLNIRIHYSIITYSRLSILLKVPRVINCHFSVLLGYCNCLKLQPFITVVGRQSGFPGTIVMTAKPPNTAPLLTAPRFAVAFESQIIGFF